MPDPDVGTGDARAIVARRDAELDRMERREWRFVALFFPVAAVFVALAGWGDAPAVVALFRGDALARDVATGVAGALALLVLACWPMTAALALLGHARVARLLAACEGAAGTPRERAAERLIDRHTVLLHAVHLVLGTALTAATARLFWLFLAGA